MDQKIKCEDCKVEMEYIATIPHNNTCESGCCDYSETLYQCPKCKTVVRG